MLRGIKFAKMHGAGNDFVVLDFIHENLPVALHFPLAAQAFCDRHFGIGADGLLLLEESSNSDCAVRMRMWNPDGSEDMCGNGLRCIARLAHLRGYADKHFQVETLAGTRNCEILSDAIRVGMGEPIFDAEKIPIRADFLNNQSPLDYTIPTTLGDLKCSTLSTGTTHTIIWRDEEISDEMFFALSPQLEIADRFPERTSLMWARVVDKNTIAIRIWERGAGETLACGTGACATAVAGQLTNRGGETVRIESRGGTLEINWRRGAEISMTGGAQLVFLGET